MADHGHLLGIQKAEHILNRRFLACFLRIDTELENLLPNQRVSDIPEQCIPGICSLVKANPAALELSVEQIVRYTNQPGAPQLLKKINAALQPLNLTEKLISPKEEKLIQCFRRIQQRSSKPETHHQDAIFPGKPWLDTKGERIQAHGGRYALRRWRLLLVW